MLPKSLIIVTHLCFLLDLQIKIVLIVKKIQFVSTVKGTFWFFRALLQTMACRIIPMTRASRQTVVIDLNVSATLSKIQNLEGTVKLCQSHD